MSPSHELLLSKISIKGVNSSGVISEWVVGTLVRRVKGAEIPQ
jgi:hypothetical protein